MVVSGGGYNDSGNGRTVYNGETGMAWHGVVMTKSATPETWQSLSLCSREPFQKLQHVREPHSVSIVIGLTVRAQSARSEPISLSFFSLTTRTFDFNRVQCKYYVVKLEPRAVVRKCKKARC